MTEIPGQSQKIDIIEQELQKPNLDEAQVDELTALLIQYIGADKARIMSHTARMTNPSEAEKTTKEYMQRLDNLFLKMFPEE